MQRTGDLQAMPLPADTRFILTGLTSSMHTGPVIIATQTPNYSQAALIQKINAYRLQTQQALYTEPGFCHGLTLLWLKRKAKGQEKKLFDLIKKIINTPDNQLMNIAEEIETLFTKINQKQNPRCYPKKYPCKDITYRQIDIILQKTEKQTIFDASYTKKTLVELIEKNTKKGNMFCVTTGFEILSEGIPGKHTIGMFVDERGVTIFDPNYSQGEEKSFVKADAAANEIFDRLCRPFNLEVPDQCALEIKMLRYKSKLVLAKTVNHTQPKLFLDLDDALDKSDVAPSNKKSQKSKSLFKKFKSIFHTTQEEEKIDQRLLLNSTETQTDVKNTL